MAYTTLSPREVRILRHRLATYVPGEFDPQEPHLYSRSDLAGRMGVTEQRIAQIEVKALGKLGFDVDDIDFSQPRDRYRIRLAMAADLVPGDDPDAW